MVVVWFHVDITVVPSIKPVDSGSRKEKERHEARYLIVVASKFYFVFVIADKEFGKYETATVFCQKRSSVDSTRIICLYYYKFGKLIFVRLPINL